MKQSIRKIMSMVLVCALAIGLCSGLAVSAEATLTLAAAVTGARVPAGEKQVVTVSGVPTGATSVSLYKAVDGETNGEALETVTELSNGTASFTVTLDKGENYFIAEATGEGVSATSSVLKLVGYYEKYGTNKWNIDFTGYEVKDHRYGYPYQSLYKGTTDTGLYGHVGTAKVSNAIPDEHNVMEVAETSDAHGSALKLTANTDDEIQFNGFNVDMNDDIVRIAWDFKLDTLPESESFDAMKVMLPYAKVGDTDRGATPLFLQKVENDYFFAVENTVGAKVSLNTWYNIVAYLDSTNKRVTYYVDDKLVGTQISDADYAGVNRVGFNLKKGKGAVAWIDNFKVDAVSLSEDPSEITLSSNAASVKVPVGAKVKLTASDLEAEATKVVFYSADAQGANKTKCAEADVANGSATAACELTGVNNYFVAEALNESGAVVGRSKVMSQAAYYDVTTKTVWDLDFNNGYIIADSTDSNTNTSVTKKLYLNNSTENFSKTFSAHLGNVTDGNTIEVADSDTEHGKALKLNAVGNAAVQLNEVHVDERVSNIRFELDYKLELSNTFSWSTTEGASTSVKIASAKFLLKSENSKSRWATLIASNRNGKYYFNSTDQEFKTDTWYKIVGYTDVKEKTTSFYVDGVLLDTVTMSDELDYLTYLQVVLQNAAGATAWIDNFKVTAVERTNSASLNVKYEIGGTEVLAMAEGDLKVTPTIDNYSDVKNVLCAVAVYGGDTLKKVKLLTKDFTSCGSYTPEQALDLGTVAATDTVKVMLWDADTLMPLCAPNELTATNN